MAKLTYLPRKKLIYREGLVNSKNEKLLASTINVLIDKIQDLIESNNQLVEEINNLKHDTSRNIK